FLLAALPYILLNSLYIFSNSLYPSDTFNFHYPVFEHTAGTFASTGTLPPFFPVSGGVRAAAYHINLFPYSPFRLLGIALAAAHVPILTAYKLQVFTGMMLTGLGWWLVLLKATGNVRAALFGLLAFLPGGATFTLHQEQVLLTMHLAPWFILALLHMRRQPLCAPAAAVLFCAALGNHYPQIQAIALPVCAACALAMTKKTPCFCAESGLKSRALTWLGAALLAAILLWPMKLLSNDITGMASPIRNSRSLSADSAANYIEMNRLQSSSSDPNELQNYLHSKKRMESPDSFAFSEGRPALVAVAFGLFLFPVGIIIPLAAALLFLLLTLGTHTPIPLLLYKLHFPFIALFRQWYHFFPFANMALSLCAALGLSSLMRRSGDGKVLARLAMALLFLQTADGCYTALKYADRTQVIERAVPLDLLMSEKKNAYGPAYIMQYASRKTLSENCPDRIPEQMTGYDSVLLAEDGKSTAALACRAQENGLKLPLLSLTPEELRRIDPETEIRVTGKNLKQARLKTKRLMLLPFNYDLGWLLDGPEGTQQLHKADGALCSFFAAKEDLQYRLKAAPDNYAPAAVAASALSLLLIGFVLFCAIKNPTTSCACPE
ncbi:MAG TPA: hypothetical protein PLL10_04515, partial [Elusimicrobiales bacterium]|nr:hypothetical protein [Elusimicrobiales bacterium]